MSHLIIRRFQVSGKVLSESIASLILSNPVTVGLFFCPFFDVSPPFCSEIFKFYLSNSIAEHHLNCCLLLFLLYTLPKR
jgi:hypothetical protein